MRWWSCGALLLAWCLGPGQSALAAVDDSLEQIEDAADEPLRRDPRLLRDRRFPPIRLTLKEEIEWGDFDGTDVTSFRSTANAEIRFPITKSYLAAISTQVGLTATDFHGNKQFIYTGKTSGDPWDNLHEFSLRYRSEYLVSDHWGLLLATWMNTRYEQGATFEDGLKGAGATAITYRFGDRLTLSAGLTVSSRIVGSSPSINPIGQFSWKIDDRHTLSSSGLGLRLRSRWSGTITTQLYARYRGRRWRLDDEDDGIVNRGSLRDRRVPIGVALQWKFLKGWRLRTDLGLVAFRQLKVTNEDGDSVDTETADAPGVFGNVLLQRRF